MLGRVDFLAGTLAVQVAVGIVKQAQLVLGFQNAAASLIDVVDGHLALVQRFFQCSQETVGHHVHVGTRVQGKCRDRLQVAHAVVDHLADGGVVGHDKAVKSPAVPQHLGHEPAVARGGDIVDDVERGHEAARSGVNTSLVGREILVEHAHVAHIDSIVVTASLGGAIEGKMLHAGHHRCLVGQVCTLIPLNHGAADG